MMEKSYSFATGNEKGTLDLYSPFEFEDKSSTTNSQDNLLKSCYIMNRVNHPDEGAIIDVKNKVLEAEREHCLIYCTQKGYMHIYDVRARNPVFDFNFGMKNGCISAMTIGPSNDQALVGTLDGSIMIYDFRYNVQTSHCRYTKDASIVSLQSFYPNTLRRILFNNAYHTYPLAFIATSDGYVSLVDLSGNSKDREIQIIMRSSQGKNKTKNIVGFFKEREAINPSDFIYQSSTLNSSVPLLQSSLISKPRGRSRIQNILHNFDTNSQTALLCPKKYNYKFSASFVLGGDASGRIRYWNIEKDYHKCKHFYLGEEEKLSYK